MEFGITLTPRADAWKVAERAEALGFSHVWFYDTQLLCADILVAMGAAAVRTERIVLGAGVLVPSNRLAAVAANAMASLNRLAPGRVIAGLGTGYTARRTMGLRAQRLAELREYARVMRALWVGEQVSCEVEGAARTIEFLQPDGFINTADPIPLHLSAFGPKARQLTAEIADGFINAWVSPDALEHARDVRAAREASGRSGSELYATCLMAGCVLEAGEPADSSRARAQAGPFPAILLHQMVEDGEAAFVPPALREVVDAYREVYERYEPADARHLRLHEGHLMYLRPDEEAFVNAGLIEAFTLTARPAVIRERVEALEAAGYDQLAIQITDGQEEALEDWAKVLLA